MKLVFKTADVKRLIEIARSAKKWWMAYSDLPPAPALLLVKDEGVYLMSNGRPQSPNDVVYANGRRPEDGHIDGGDWAETFPVEDLEKLTDGTDEIEFTVTSKTIKLAAYRYISKSKV